jgi:hypothetical protein
MTEVVLLLLRVLTGLRFGFRPADLLPWKLGCSASSRSVILFVPVILSVRSLQWDDLQVVVSALLARSPNGIMNSHKIMRVLGSGGSGLGLSASAAASSSGKHGSKADNGEPISTLCTRIPIIVGGIMDKCMFAPAHDLKSKCALATGSPRSLICAIHEPGSC